MTHSDVGPQIVLDKGEHTDAQEVLDGISREVRPEDLLRCSPNMFTSPSEASKKEAVSTPSLVTGTSANDCMHEGIRERNGA